jgi:methylated-DNA-[protein]-cysteine S-methyltransferase
MTTFYTTFESPVGPLLLMSDGTSLTGVHTDNDKHRPAVRPDWICDDSVAPFAQTIAQLRAYFDGALTGFDLPLAPQGTEFQMTVWRELCNIPFGETISYAELARRIGRPTASRAVGHSNARNPISIIVPCHRVIGADQSLTGYAGGLERKRALLALEGRNAGTRGEGRQTSLDSHKGIPVVDHNRAKRVLLASHGYSPIRDE